MSNTNPDIKNRLSKIEGQVKGVKSMLDSGRPCEELLMQLSSISAAITGVAKVILNEHINHCIVEGIKCGDEEQTVDMLRSAVDQFAKMK